MADVFPHDRIWRFTLGAVVTWTKTLQADNQRREVGHVLGFARDDHDLILIRVRWQTGATADHPPGYLRLEKDH